MEINVNGVAHEVPGPPDRSLLWVLRDQLGLTGTKCGCEAGVCGACILEIDGAQAHACQVTVAGAMGKRIVTIEGRRDLIGQAVLQAWGELDVAQCGFCQPAQINSACILLAHNPSPTDGDIDEAMQPNLCRCGTYLRIRRAIHAAAGKLASQEGVKA